jgi:hypothetical protein
MKQTKPFREASQASQFSQEWIDWIVVNKQRHVDDQTLIEVLKEHAISEEIAIEAVRSARLPGRKSYNRDLARKLDKLEGLLTMYGVLNAQHPLSGKVERRRNLSPEGFQRNYYCANRPVVLLDLMRDWKALSLWTPKYLKDQYANQMVEITANRLHDMSYEINLDQHRKKVRFGDYVDMVLGGGRTNDFYMTANNHVLESEGMKTLLNDIVIFPGLLDPNKADGTIFFWFGPAGTVTPLHHDLVNIFMAQVRGRKLVKLIPSHQLPLVYNHVGVFSEVDCERPNYGKYPRFRSTIVTDVTLNPGEVLFIPVGWWHYVRALDTSITVTLDNFVFPNEYEWS